MNPLPSPRPSCAVIVLASVFAAACNPKEKPAAAPETATAVESPAADKFIILPGDYSQKTTVADLEARFGKANVLRETEPAPRVVLFPDDPTRRAFVTFHEAAEFKELAHISVSDPGSLWRGKHGAHVGMTFAKLRELNGKPFYYTGFDEQKRGGVHDSWSPSMSDDDSSLGAFDVAENDHLYFNVELGVGDPARIKGVADLPVDERLSSDDPRFPNLGAVIVVTGIGASSSLDDEWE
ncbi:MAG: hypothetical protein V4819_18240 [Verrucomicrobiota bacterium]